ncbi:MAG: hypothetical protein ACYDBV_13760 [Nitrospiria bacterium]
METLTTFGALMLQNELSLLKLIVGISFFGWILLIMVQVVWLDEFPLRRKDSPQRTQEDLPQKEFLKAA